MQSTRMGRPRKIHPMKKPNQDTILAFSEHYPGWQMIVSGHRPGYKELAHQAFKYRFREEIAAWPETHQHCVQCREKRLLVADPPEGFGFFRGMVCRPCRKTLSKVEEFYWPYMADFWPQFCIALCPKADDERQSLVCVDHQKLSEFWALAWARQQAYKPVDA